MQDEGLLDIFAAAMTLNQGGESDEVGLDTATHSIIAVEGVGNTFAAHILENLSGLVDVSTPNTAVDDGVKGYDIWFDVLATILIRRGHDKVDLQRLLKIEGSAVGFDHGGVYHSVRLDGSLLDNFMENLLSFVDLAISYASVY